MARLTVLVVDDHPVVAAGLVADLTAIDPDLQVTAVGSVAEAVTRCAADPPDVVVTDILFGSAPDGLALPERVAPIPVLIFTSYDRPGYQRLAMESGAVGFLTKDRPLADLAAVIRRCANGESVFSRRALRSALASPRPPSAAERRVIELIAAGASSAEAGLRLGISEHTVETHLRRMFLRYDVASRTELVVRAIAEGWIVPPS
jgi:DNA-binding NarL/FixJ family response regulator